MRASPGNGYWMDAQPGWTGLGKTSQVLRLDKPHGEWEGDLELATGTEMTD